MSIPFNPPREKTPNWSVGDVVMDGRVRWIIRTIVRRKVELEASNAMCGIWWHTTLDNLPTKGNGR